MNRIILFLILLLASAPASAGEVDGKAIYQRDCIACHGADGSGKTPLGRQMKPYPARDLRPRILSREEIRHVILEGREKTGMHARSKELDQAATDHLIGYVLSFTYQANPERGRQIFKQRCSRCHSTEGISGNATKAPDLVMSELSDIGMASAIRNGHRGTIMGGFKHDMGNAETEDVIVWLRLNRYGLAGK